MAHRLRVVAKSVRTLRLALLRNNASAAVMRRAVGMMPAQIAGAVTAYTDTVTIMDPVCTVITVDFRRVRPPPARSVSDRLHAVVASDGL